MFQRNLILLLILMPLCLCETPYLLRSYPTESVVQGNTFTTGPCIDPLKTLAFLQSTDDDSIEHNECAHDQSEAVLTCKLGVKNASETLNLDDYPVDSVKVLILFVQEFPAQKVKVRVLDLCFLGQFGALEELAICSYKPDIEGNKNSTDVHILDIPALAIFESKIQTLLIRGVDLWQSVELRQFTNLKHLLIFQGVTRQMQYYHSPHCADCIGMHPNTDISFHYLIPLQSQLSYYLYEASYSYDDCSYDLLKRIQSKTDGIPTFIVVSNKFSGEKDTPICDTCESRLCPLLAVCLDDKSEQPRKTKDGPFECLCVEDVKAKDEFISCDPMTLHPPMYSTRCNHTPSFWNYVTLPMLICVSYVGSSYLVFLISTLFLFMSKK